MTIEVQLEHGKCVRNLWKTNGFVATCQIHKGICVRTLLATGNRLLDHQQTSYDLKFRVGSDDAEECARQKLTFLSLLNLFLLIRPTLKQPSQ